MNFSYIFSIALLVFGFGFVIFWHELGHFLAAKWVGVKVEQFAVGFGHAILSWRKGIGLRIGNTQREYERRVNEYIEKEEGHFDRKDTTGPTQEQVTRAAGKLGLGDTEYRLNWIPLGGYVKMLGQDDLNPNAQSDDPRAFNRKSIPARMLVVSAGVIMNVILAAIGFMIVFRMGFRVAPAEVGGVTPGSPAQQAGLRVGDQIWTYDGRRQYDWTKIQLNVALSGDGEAVPMEVYRTEDGQRKLVNLSITPRRDETYGFVSIGIAPARSLQGVPQKQELDPALVPLIPREMLAVRPGDVITAINGQPVERDDYPRLHAALQESFGQPVKLTVTDASGVSRQVDVQPRFSGVFGREGFNLLGMAPRARVFSVLKSSPARDKLKPGDVVLSLLVSGDPTPHPSMNLLRQRLNRAGQAGKSVTLHVLREGREVAVEGLTPDGKIDRNTKGLGVSLALDEANAVVAAVESDSLAARANIPPGAVLTSIDGKPASSWYDVHRHLSGVAPGESVEVVYTAKNQEQLRTTITLDRAAVASIQSVAYTDSLSLAEPRKIRETDNSFVALKWGVTETRDFILQFYLTLRRMFDGTVSPTNLMGPIGIFDAGTRFAYKGHDWLIWFLSMISANLAVVNFLPIPIVDGGLFTFLILEKIKGRPLSARTHTIAQFVGMALLLCVFLFVTYNDITRLSFMR